MRIDELEESINDLKAEMGRPSKVKDEESKPADSSA
jgi:heat shock factor-binding protein 1